MTEAERERRERNDFLDQMAGMRKAQRHERRKGDSSAPLIPNRFTRRSQAFEGLMKEGEG